MMLVLGLTELTVTDRVTRIARPACSAALYHQVGQRTVGPVVCSWIAHRL